MTSTEFNSGLTFVISQKTGSGVTNLYPITKLANVRYEDESGNIVNAEDRIAAIETAASTLEATVEANKAEIEATVEANKEAADTALSEAVATLEAADSALGERVTAIEDANDGQLVPDYSEETVSNLRFLRNDNTWADIQEATTEQYGVTILSDAVDSDSSDTAATSKAVKAAYDKAMEMIPLTQIGVSGGVAPLDDDALVPAAYLPSYVDDVIEGTYQTSTIFVDADNVQITGETGKIYVDTSTKLTYRWSGSMFVEISASLALGETNDTAFYGDLGKIAYDYSQATHMEESSNNGYVIFDGTEYLVYTHPTSTSPTNPHDTTAEDVGLGNVENLDGQTLVNTYIQTDDVVLVDNTTNLEHPGAMSADMLTQLQGLMNVYVQSTEPEITDTTSSTILWFNTSES